jgi:hypothetical protein
MPYISKLKREELDKKIEQLLLNIDQLNVGELNYTISNIINYYIRIKSDHKEFNYELCNSLIGVLECAKLELYRKVVSPYEDKKIKENGKLYLDLD